MSQAVSQSLDLQQIIDSALDKVAKSIAIAASYVYLFENDQLVLKGCYGLTPQRAAAINKEVDGGIIGRVFKQAEPIVIDKIDETDKTSRTPQDPPE